MLCSSLLTILVARTGLAPARPCLVGGSPKLEAVLQMWSHKCCMEGKKHLPWCAGYILANQPSLQLAAFAARAHWNSSSICSPGHPGLFLWRCFLSTCFPGCTVAHAYSILITEFLICLCWTSWSCSCQPIFPVFLGHPAKPPAV